MRNFIRRAAVTGLLTVAAAALVGPIQPAQAAVVDGSLTVTDRSTAPFDTGNGFARVPNSPDPQALWDGNSFQFGPDTSGSVYRQATGTVGGIPSVCSDPGATVELSATADAELFQNRGEWFTARFGFFSIVGGETKQTGGTDYPGTYSLGTTNQFPAIGEHPLATTATVSLADLQAGKVGLYALMETHQSGLAKYWIVDNLAVTYSYSCQPAAANDTQALPSTGGTFDLLGNDSPVSGHPFDPASVRLLDGPNLVTTLTNADGTYVVNTSTGEVEFTPVSGFTGSATPIGYSVADGDGDRATATFTVTVAPEVEVPIFDPAVTLGALAAAGVLVAGAVMVRRRQRA